METKCPVCGAVMENGTCGYCGYAEPKPVQVDLRIKNVVNAPEVSSKSKVLALLLCIFFGVVGAHRFYVGKAGTGILYFFTAGLCGFGWIIDIILIATGSFKDKFGLPLRQ